MIAVLTHPYQHNVGCKTVSYFEILLESRSASCSSEHYRTGPGRETIVSLLKRLENESAHFMPKCKEHHIPFNRRFGESELFFKESLHLYERNPTSYGISAHYIKFVSLAIFQGLFLVFYVAIFLSPIFKEIFIDDCSSLIGAAVQISDHGVSAMRDKRCRFHPFMLSSASV